MSNINSRTYYTAVTFIIDRTAYKIKRKFSSVFYTHSKFFFTSPIYKCFPKNLMFFFTIFRFIKIIYMKVFYFIRCITSNNLKLFIPAQKFEFFIEDNKYAGNTVNY